MRHLGLGLAALAVVSPDRAAFALAASQLAGSLVPLGLLLAATTPRHLGAILRPWLALAPMALATTLAAALAPDWPPGAVFALQALAGTAAFAASLPFLVRRTVRR